MIINGIEIERVTYFNFLGLTINENISWKPHINKIASKISKYTGIMNRLKRFLPLHILRVLYCSMKQSNLDYSLLVWGFDLSRLQKNTEENNKGDHWKSL